MTNDVIADSISVLLNLNTDMNSLLDTVEDYIKHKEDSLDRRDKELFQSLNVMALIPYALVDYFNHLKSGIPPVSKSTIINYVIELGSHMACVVYFLHTKLIYPNLQIEKIHDKVKQLNNLIKKI